MQTLVELGPERLEVSNAFLFNFTDIANLNDDYIYDDKMMRPANLKMIKQEAGNGMGQNTTPKIKKATLVVTLQQDLKQSVKKIKI